MTRLDSFSGTGPTGTVARDLGFEQGQHHDTSSWEYNGFDVGELLM